MNTSWSCYTVARRFLVFALLLGSAVLPAWAQPADTSAPRLVPQLGHHSAVTSVAFSPDGAFALTLSSGVTRRESNGVTRRVGIARLWEVKTGTQLRVFRERFEAWDAGAAALSPEGTLVWTEDKEDGSLWDVRGTLALNAVGGGAARLWDRGSGEELHMFRGHSGGIASVALSPDGALALTVSGRGTARLWDVETGKRHHTLGVDGVTMSEFSPDGAYVLTVGERVRLWDVETGKQRMLGVPAISWYDNLAAFSPDGAFVLTVNRDGTARLWDVETGEERHVFEGHVAGVTSVAFSPDGAYILTGNRDGAAQLWDVEMGEQIHVLGGYVNGVTSVALSPDGALASTVSGRGTARLWDVETGEERHVFEGDHVTSVAFSPDGAFVLGSDRLTARLWDAETGKELRFFRNWNVDQVTSVAFSPDGAFVLTGNRDGTARLWDVETGEELRVFGGHEYLINSVAFSPDGTLALTGSNDDTARLWDVETGEELHVFMGHSDWVTSVAFSPNGTLALTGSNDGTARLWDVETGGERHVFEGHVAGVTSVAFSPDGAFVLTGADDGTTQLWSVETREEVVQLLSFRDKTWAVIDQKGRFDASDGGDIDGLVWVTETPNGPEPIELSQFKDRYYHPDLLARKLGYSDESLRDVESIKQFGVQLHPGVHITQREGRQLELNLTNRGGGIGRVQVLVNGNEVAADARPRNARSDADSLTLSVDLSAYEAFLIPDQENTIEVIAYNAEGSLKSRSVPVSVRGRPAEDSYEPHFWAVVAGVSEYAGTDLDLRFAAKDAHDFAQGLDVAAGRLFTPERTHISVLSMRPGSKAPTLDNLTAALDSVATQADPRDVLVVYLAGHGVTHGGQDGDFYYLTAEAATGNLTDAALRATTALSSDSLTAHLKRIPALKRVLILDTCASGRVVERLTEERDIPGSQVRSLDRLKDRTGMFVLAGSAADAVSYEASRFGQGLLTWSLLAGMRGEALKEGVEVDVSTLFGFAADRVPQLARSIGGIQRPILAMPRGGGSFPIGHVRPEDQARIPLAVERPLVLRAQFQDEVQFADRLELARRVNEQLREVSYRGGGSAPLIFVDASQYVEAYQAVGRYRVEGSQVHVELRVFKDGKTEHTSDVTGALDGLDGLADSIVALLQQAFE